MFNIVERRMLVPNLHLLIVEAPDVAEVIQPGQFVIIRSHDDAERIPLSVSDWDRDKGTLTLVFMEVGASTSRLASLKPGDAIPTVVGPLGKPTEIEKFGHVLCISGCYGIGSILPLVKALIKLGNKVTTVIEARSHYLLYWEDKLKEAGSEVLVMTRDGSRGEKGHSKRLAAFIYEKGIIPQRIFVNGCTFLMSLISKDFTSFDVPIIVNLNPIMIDGTGMCGVCRVTVDGHMRFACVDGPDFDGRLIDWEEFLKRRKQYIEEEAASVHHTGCTWGC
jgi:ferredoxin/flavodoxin---NADP+ reductase